MENTKTFPNGFTSWQETHYEIVAQMQEYLQMGNVKPIPKAVQIEESQGRGGLYELAEELTDKFELLNEGRLWDGEFFEELDIFLITELN